MQVAQDSHVEARVTDLPAPWSLSRPAQCLRQPPALLCRLGPCSLWSALGAQESRLPNAVYY